MGAVTCLVPRGIQCCRNQDKSDGHEKIIHLTEKFYAVLGLVGISPEALIDFRPRKQSGTILSCKGIWKRLRKE